MWFVVTRQRRDKTERIMQALAAGYPGKWKMTERAPPDGEPFVIWGHRWLSEEIIPRAQRAGTPFFAVDNGYLLPAKGTAVGYYSLTRGGFAPAFLPNADRRRLPVEMAPWREGAAGRVLLAFPGAHYLGANMGAWTATIVDRIRKHTDRPIMVRHKDSARPLAADLADAFVLVTHSSKVAVDAVRAGVPVIVEPTSPAAPVGSTDLADIERPPTPLREAWHSSLMSQQFTLAEMASGLPWRILGAPTHGMDSRSQADELVAAGAGRPGNPGLQAGGLSGQEALRALRHRERVRGGGSATG